MSTQSLSPKHSSPTHSATLPILKLLSDSSNSVVTDLKDYSS